MTERDLCNSERYTVMAIKQDDFNYYSLYANSIPMSWHNGLVVRGKYFPDKVLQNRFYS